ncbi:hypothetical protein LTR70_010368 [Exophiala xenobiotica]|uniref:Uncharacterized protein n=1 Tax=Lithohypha guttulata TaxID=1690604 RepID=A0ABR0JUL6_9EURO|nr:hypothetical protein LTR24_010329 [Lithohypha guttulata]KAK5309353.1 hypothetical protein LTR70_010368 [Exophiala xenobiotica]
MRAAYNKDHVERYPYFLIREVGKPAKDQRKLLEHFAVDQMISQGVFPPQKVSLVLSNRTAETEFLLNLCDNCQSTEFFHISGGTRCFVDEIIQGMQSNLSSTFVKPTQVGAIDLATLNQKKDTWSFEAADFLRAGKDPFQHFNDIAYRSTGGAKSSLMSRYLGSFRPPDQVHVTNTVERPRRSILPWRTRVASPTNTLANGGSCPTEKAALPIDYSASPSDRSGTHEAMSTELRNTRHKMSSEGTSGVQSRMASMNQARASSGDAGHNGSELNIFELPPVKTLHIGQFAAHEVMDTKTREPMDIHNHPMYPPSIS